MDDIRKVYMSGGGSGRLNEKLIRAVKEAGFPHQWAGRASLGSKRMSIRVDLAYVVAASKLGLKVQRNEILNPPELYAEAQRLIREANRQEKRGS